MEILEFATFQFHFDKKGEFDCDRNFEESKSYGLFHDSHREVPEGIEFLFQDTLEFSLKYLSQVLCLFTFESVLK